MCRDSTQRDRGNPMVITEPDSTDSDPGREPEDGVQVAAENEPKAEDAASDGPSTGEHERWQRFASGETSAAAPGPPPGACAPPGGSPRAPPAANGPSPRSSAPSSPSP
nr:hypothetical protein GCM10025732_07340 [Glycomyces mayteni]